MVNRLLSSVKWVLLGQVALGDVLLIGASAYTVWYLGMQYPWVIVLVAAAGWEWAQTGGFMAWRALLLKEERAKFLKSFRSIGL